jgi:phage shock protein C
MDIRLLQKRVIKISKIYMKRLTKSADKKICGVCGGVAEYFGWDPTWVRFGTVLLTLCYGSGLFAYIVAAIVMPNAE